jgi:ATP-dependent helicase/nuclease subunit A
MKERFELSAEQRDAIHAPGNVVVRAGAGSGKTEVLARRFIALIAGDIAGAEWLEPRQVAAITFSEKATAEMKSRIATVLEERLNESSSDDERTHLARARRGLGFARISTIHAFCAALLRENPMQAGLDPSFEVLDEHESGTLTERICEEFLVEAIRADNPGARRLVAARRLRGAMREGALETVCRLVSDLKRIGREPDWLVRQAERTSEELSGMRRQLRQASDKLIRLIERDLLPTSGLKSAAARKIEQLGERWPEYKQVLERLDTDSDDSVLALLQRLAASLPSATGNLKNPLLKIKVLIKRSGDEKFPLGGELVELFGSCRSARPTIEIARLVARTAERVEEIKQREGVVTFDDLLGRTRAMLQGYPDVLRRYQSELRALLVDEYQDTDPIQDEIVGLVTERGEGAGQPQLFIVGDEKQSIYRFRGADLTVFGRRLESVPDGPALRENRRSVPNILKFINGLAASTLRSELSPPPPFWVEWRAEHELKAVRADGATPSVEFILTDLADGLKATEKRALEAQALARLVGEIATTSTGDDRRQNGSQRKTRFGDIAILMRAFSDVEIYEQALRKADIPFLTVRGRGFFGCAEISDVANLLAVLNRTDDEIALAAVLRSPLFGLSDQCLLELALDRPRHEGWLTALFCGEKADFGSLQTEREEAHRAREIICELRQLRAELPLADLIERALELTGLEAVMLALDGGRQRRANLRKLVDLARSFQARRCFGFADFIAHLRRLVASEPYEAQAQIAAADDDAVRLMTIHQAKGLEFPVVIVADLGRGTPSNNQRYVLSPERGLIACATAGSGHDELPSALLREYREGLKQQEAAESARLLYVAMTRARDRLILSGGTGGSGWSSQIRAFIGIEPVADFLVSGRESVSVEAGGAEVILRHMNKIANLPTVGAVAGDQTRPGTEDIAELVRRRMSREASAAQVAVASPTELADFDLCPRRYYLRYVVGAAEKNLFKAQTGHALEMGLVAHAVLEQLEPSLEAEAAARYVAQLVDRHSIGTPLTAAERDTLKRDLTSYALRRIADIRAAIVPIAEEREVPFFLRLSDGGLELYLKGRIDLLIQSNGNFTIRDYKYSEPSEEHRTHYEIQTRCYALAAAEAHDVPRVDAQVVFLRDGPRMVELAMPEAEVIRAELLKFGHQLAAAGKAKSYPKKPEQPKVCHGLGCGYVGRCWGDSGRLERDSTL